MPPFIFSHFWPIRHLWKKIIFRLSRTKTVDFAKKESHCTFLCLPSLLLLNYYVLFRSKKHSNSQWLIGYYNRKYVIYYCNQKLDVRKNDSPEFPQLHPPKLIVILCAVPFQDRSTERIIYTQQSFLLLSTFLFFSP